jgi:hypothetical protein
MWLLRRDRFERELEEEIPHHLAMSGGDTVAVRRFGNVALIREESRAMWTFAFWEQLAQDIGYGLRTMARNKFFTTMAVLSLALGIGANTAIYKYFPGQNPVGKHFRLGTEPDSPDATIAGVAKNARYDSLKRQIPPVMYLAYRQAPLKHPPSAMYFEIRTAGDPLALAETARKIVHEASASVPVAEITTHAAIIDNTLGQKRTFADLWTSVPSSLHWR